VQSHLPALLYRVLATPKNDRLIYLTAVEVAAYLDEIESSGLGTSPMGFTGAELFMSPDLPAILEMCSRGVSLHWC
jgi:hypothetical protein